MLWCDLVQIRCWLLEPDGCHELQCLLSLIDLLVEQIEVVSFSQVIYSFEVFFLLNTTCCEIEH